MLCLEAVVPPLGFRGVEMVCHMRLHHFCLNLTDLLEEYAPGESSVTQEQRPSS